MRSDWRRQPTAYRGKTAGQIVRPLLFPSPRTFAGAALVADAHPPPDTVAIAVVRQAPPHHATIGIGSIVAAVVGRAQREAGPEAQREPAPTEAAVTTMPAAVPVLGVSRARKRRRSPRDRDCCRSRNRRLSKCRTHLFLQNFFSPSRLNGGPQNWFHGTVCGTGKTRCRAGFVAGTKNPARARKEKDAHRIDIARRVYESSDLRGAKSPGAMRRMCGAIAKFSLAVRCSPLRNCARKKPQALEQA